MLGTKVSLSSTEPCQSESTPISPKDFSCILFRVAEEDELVGLDYLTAAVPSKLCYVSDSIARALDNLVRQW